jgi:putative transcriptional regulator
MYVKSMSAKTISEEIGERLKQARLNADQTQAEVAKFANLSRKTVVNAEQGNVKLENLVSIMMVLHLTPNLDVFLPKQEVSPIELSKLHGKRRQRASGTRGLDRTNRSDW